MKKLISLIILTAAFSVYAQTADEKETVKKSNENVVSLYRSQKFDDALQAARQALDLTIKIYGNEQPETASAYNNLGVIYRAKKKYKEATENLQKSLAIYQKISSNRGAEIIGVYQTLASVQFLDGKQGEAEASYSRALEVAENTLGKESKETFLPVFSLAKLYARDENFDKSDEFYLRTYALALKIYGRKAKEIEQIDDSRICLNRAVALNSRREKEKAFDGARAKIFGVSDVAKTHNILNGMALSLPAPAYTPAARVLRLGGAVPVKVVVNEQGDVIKAISICRDDALGTASEDAARRAKFAVTLVDGKPVQVTGVIIYNFIL